MFDSIAAAVVVVDTAGHIVAWNPACAALTGRSLEDVRGRPALELLATPEEAREAMRLSSPVGAVLREEPERRYPADADEHRWISWRVTPMVGADGNDYAVALGVDVTDRRRAEDAALKSQATLDGVISIAADAIISIDENHRIVIFNEGAEAIFGYRGDEVVGELLEILLPERFQRAHLGHIRHFASSPERARQMGQRSEVFGRRKSGEEFPAEAAISKLKIDGRMMFTVVLRDVTDRKRAELQQKFLMEASEVLASSIDYQETLRTVAKLAVAALAGCCVVDIVDQETARVRRLTVIVTANAPVELEEHWLDRSRPHVTRTALERGEETLISELQEGYLEGIVQSDGLRRLVRETKPRSLIVVPLVVQSRVLGAIALLSGPSGHYGLEELRLAEELARRAALAIDNAIHYTRARSAIHTREEILAIVSHDLRNLLSQTLMGASFLAETAADAETLATIGIVRRSAERMNRLVGDLLDFANVSAGRLAIELRPTRAMALVREALALLAPAAADSSLELRADVHNDELDVVCDPGRILQVLSNLIGNAIKFSPPGSGIAVRVESKPGELWFSVADSGRGIAKDQQRHVFDRYWRANTGSTPGSGLGLAISKGIVEAHGARIWVESEVGVGSTFFFTLPVGAPP
ncbi:MAG: PAS domain-containing sensor histidine kinase [Byssovorax sp.]